MLAPLSCLNSITISSPINPVSLSNNPTNFITIPSNNSGNSVKLSNRATCQPNVKHKEIGSHHDVAVVTSANKTWLQMGSHKLTLYDQMTLINSSELNDRHINFAQYLLLNQFPSMKGFRTTCGRRSLLPYNYQLVVCK